ncbi:hypothetical protein M3Y99_00333600 [Aphelenchoides fujianensis]|nr:hypothetical protein M3Y99_00333600 [Aphelenchoides fujianensis]
MPAALRLLVVASVFWSCHACLSSAPRTQQPAYAPQYQGVQGYQYQGQAPQVAQPQVAQPPFARGASNLESAPIAPNQANGYSSGLTVPWGSRGYNDRGGGPVGEGTSLKCDFETENCCWANLPAPEDQIDWNRRQGLPDERYPNITIDGHYLIATAVASPSDEAQLTSCAIACASSPIRVRVKHWQQRALLQVCLRESFPETTNFNPLLNCQEFPPTPNGPLYTEVELPKNSVVDVVFVASDFVDPSGGSIAVLDDIEVYYERDPRECEQRIQAPAPTEEANARQTASVRSTGAAAAVDASSGAEHAVGSGASGSQGAAAGGGGFGGSRSESTFESSANSNSNSNSESSSFRSTHQSIEKMNVAHASKTETRSHLETSKMTEFSSEHSKFEACKTIKCNFEDGRTCAYEDMHVQDEIRGQTTQFQVTKGQFMNRITGIKESPEGDFYAATFIYPNERAGLAADVNFIDDSMRIRFQFYESTHGVQLKGCCDSIDSCPFGTDKFVSVADRTWKYGDFTCPQGTKKVIFFCENSRTNQGACALDEILVLDSAQAVETAKPLC